MSSVQRELVRQHLWLVRLHLKRRVHLPRRATRSCEAEDLYQEGCLGLIRAAMSYDASRDGAFEPYALARIRGAVHKAIHERFATVRVPIGAIERRKAAAKRAAGGGADESPAAPWGRRVEKWLDGLESRSARGDDVIDASRDGDASGGETIAQHLRAKHRIALAVAVERVAGRCRHPGVRPVLEAIAAERLAIPCERERTALRAIGRRFGVSIGRAVEWQRGVEREARIVLGEDDEFVLLKRRSGESRDGVDRRVDADLATELARVRARTFERAVSRRDPVGRALALVSLLSRAGKDPLREAGTLFAGLPDDAQRELVAALSG
jgi:RNA polymerase sigma factor (sigma-70 family)